MYQRPRIVLWLDIAITIAIDAWLHVSHLYILLRLHGLVLPLYYEKESQEPQGHFDATLIRHRIWSGGKSIKYIEMHYDWLVYYGLSINTLKCPNIEIKHRSKKPLFVVKFFSI